MPTGLDALNSTDAAKVIVPTSYACRLAERRETEEIRQLSHFGLVLGWLCTLLGGFCSLCVISRIDGLWFFLTALGLVMLTLGTIVPQALYWPHRLWMRIAHWQGRLVMTVLLTIAYVTLIWPLGWWEKRKNGGCRPFYTWDMSPPQLTTGWEPLSGTPAPAIACNSARLKTRSLFWLFFETLAFFARRGHYLLLPVLILLLLLGLILFFVQSSVLAPFIYTIAVAS